MDDDPRIFWGRYLFCLWMLMTATGGVGIMLPDFLSDFVKWQARRKRARTT